MNCACHDEPAYRSGKSWRCAVRKRAYARALYLIVREEKTRKQRERYDSDAVYRIEKNLHDHARRRADTLKRRRERLG